MEQKNEKWTTRLRGWARRNEDALVVGSAVTIYVDVVGAIVYAVKREQDTIAKAEEDRQQLIMNAVRSGKQILPNPDGSFWIIDPVKTTIVQNQRSMTTWVLRKA